ncbi:S41 family peptidase [Tamaricihabitans halophyticus]|uniref:S41 family peptidase n=1 Tax=Tamaricihabitans halophyticus TaxID=1262583 RepID=UPI0010447C89|nr:S41 family peptidase [Tamaricihabitans halophyticus]
MTDAYLRFPHLAGDLLTFVAEDDVWLAPITGGRAWRLSADRVTASYPRLSPDGTRIAWTSARDVEPEVQVANTDGGGSRRLTYWGDVRTSVHGWLSDTEVLALSCVGETSSRHSWAYAVPLDGGPARRLPYGPVGGIAVGASATVLVSAGISQDAAWRKRYRGGTAGKLWVDQGNTGEFTRLAADLDGNLSAPMLLGERVVFLSDHDGVANVYSCALDGSELRRHTEHEFYARNASTDGERVVYHCAGDVWLLDGLDAQPRKVDIQLGGPQVARQPFPVAATDELNELCSDHTGRASAVEVRGTVHWLSHRDGPVRALSVRPGVRARLPQVLGERGLVAWVSDVDGDDALEVVPTTGLEPGGSTRRLAAGKLGRVLELIASPDGKRLGVISHDGRVLLIDVDSGELSEVDRGTEQDPAGLTFSPDSGYLAWSHPGPDPLRHIKLANTTDLSVVDVTTMRFVDYDPVFTVDGKYLAFLSARNFDPIYDAHVFDLAFPNGVRPYLVPLAADTPSPFAPQLDGRPVGDESESEGESDGDSGSPRTRLDIDGLTERAVAFPVPAARYVGLRAAKGGLLWLREQVSGVLGDDLAGSTEDGQPCALERFALDKRKAESLVDDVEEYWVSGDGARIVLREHGKLRVQPADKKVDSDDSDDRVDVDLSRVRVTVDPAAEWPQAFDEAGRLMRDHFWRADMGGVDWSAVLDRYRPLVDRVGSGSEFVDLLWEVQGELATSHAYVVPPGSGGDPKRRQGLLGADLRREAGGSWVIARILPGDTSDPQARSPLSAPGVGIRQGDAVLAVDGRPVDPVTGPAPLLAGTADKPVELTVRPAGGGEPRRVVIVPLLDEMPLRYQAWVVDRRAHVHAMSGGRVGYLHVPDMLAPGWAQLHRDLRVEVRNEALVVDVRENRGGHLSQLVVEKLARKVIGWQTGRDGYHATSYPSDAPRGPVVAVADEFSGSDGDIVNAAIKAMGIGPVVGTRTWGGTIGIDMRYHLVDGTLVTQPRYATWLAGPGWGVENHGVEPDVEVVQTPQDYAAGRDPQLNTAVELALAELERTPAASMPEPPPL